MFQKIIDKSFVMEGRFLLAPWYGNDLNADNFDKLASAKRWDKKYPIVVMYPPVEHFDKNFHNPGKPGYVTFDIILLFLATTYIDGDNNVQDPDPVTGVSTHPVEYYWADMSRCARDFMGALTSVMNGNNANNIRLNGGLIGIDGSTIPHLTRITMTNNDRLSGVRMDFRMYAARDCSMSDYSTDDLAQVDLSGTDNFHLIHKL